MIKRSLSISVAALIVAAGTWLQGHPVSAETAPTLVSLQNGVVSPWGDVIQGPDRTLYGTTHDGGVLGTVYKIAPSSTSPQMLYNFKNRSDGSGTDAPVIQGQDGRLYGTTYYDGGTTRCGTIFAVNPDGSGYTVLHTFADSDGCNPKAGLVQADSGYLYGTAFGGGPNHLGAIFRIAPDGSNYSVLHMFTNVNEGSNPQSGLIEGRDGRLYGTTFGGGAKGGGIVFAINPDGSGFSTIYSLGRTPTDGGANPRSGLVQGPDGALYGTTSAAGQNGFGSVFKVTSSGTFSVLHTFSGGSDGKSPHAELLLAGDGKLYGTAQAGGAKDWGQVFSVGTDGSGYTVVHTFMGGASDGAIPETGLIQADDGSLVGTTTTGGVRNSGTVYTLNLGLLKPAPTTRLLSPTSGTTGTSVLIHGRYFVNVTGVTVGGAQAAFTTPSAEWMRLTVPANAISGPVVITTPAGSVTAGQFKVLPTVSGLSVSSGDVGQQVVITGTGFSGVKSVSFNGASAAFTINSPTQITTSVPNGASTGAITVSTADASAASGTFTYTGKVQPTPTATTTSTPPTATPAAQPSVAVQSAALTHAVKGKSARTSRLKSGERGLFTVTYAAQNAGSQHPTATLTILNGSKTVGAPIDMAASGSSFTASKSFKTRKPMSLTAKFTITLGSSQASRTLSFKVTPK